MFRRGFDHSFFDLPEFAVSGHRGAGGICPENTSFSFQTAVDQGANILETDIHSTLEGVPVLSHDPDVDRITNGSGLIEHYKLADLQRLDAGYRFSPDGGKTYPYRGLGHHIPTLREAFETFSDKRFTLDMKAYSPKLLADVFDLIDEFERADLTLVTSFDWRITNQIDERIKKTGLRVATAASKCEVRRCVITSMLGRMYPSKETMSLFVPPTAGEEHGDRFPTIITPRFNKQAHALGIPIFVWTINEPDKMRDLAEKGVNGIVTDHPAVAVAVRDGRQSKMEFALSL